MKFFLIFIFSSLSFVRGESVPKTIFDMKDLEVLEKENNFSEFLEHAKDIRPKERDENWHKMINKMALSFVKHKLENTHFDESAFSKIEDLVKWPSLKNNEILHIKRNQFGVKFLKQCFLMSPNSKSCRKFLSIFWKNTLYKSDTGVQIALMAKEKLFLASDRELFEYISESIKSNMATFHCRKSYVKEIYTAYIMGKMEQMLTLGKNYENLLRLLKKSSHDDCWTHLLPDFRQSLFSSSPSTSSKFYHLLKVKNSLSEEDEDLYLTLFILNGPIVGEIFNLSWSRFEILSQNLVRREKVLKKLQNFEPLPGKIFQTSDQLKRETLTKLISETFPEYIDFYARTCLNYLEGKKSYPFGNPTIECRDLFNIDKKKKFIDQGIHLRYSAIKKNPPTGGF